MDQQFKIEQKGLTTSVSNDDGNLHVAVANIIGDDPELCSEIVSYIKAKKSLEKFSEEMSTKKFELLKNLSLQSGFGMEENLNQRVTEIIQETANKTLDELTCSQIATCLEKNRNDETEIRTQIGIITKKFIPLVILRKVLPSLLQLVVPPPEEGSTPLSLTEKELIPLVTNEIQKILEWHDVPRGDDNFYEEVTQWLLKGGSLVKFKDSISKRKYGKIENEINNHKELAQAIATLCPNEETLKKSLLEEVIRVLPGEDAPVDDDPRKGNISNLVVSCLLVSVPMEVKDLLSKQLMRDKMSQQYNGFIVNDFFVPQDFESLCNYLCSDKKILDIMEKFIKMRGKEQF